MRSAEGKALRFEVSALTGEPPLTRLTEKQLLKPETGGDPRLRRVLTFLSFREKLLAGSWRFLTYFGRDTLMFLQLMMPVLTAEGVEAGLRSVFSRMNGTGEIAHEEEIGEFAVLRRFSYTKSAGRSGATEPANFLPDSDPSTPVYDYRMVDDDFLLLPVAAEYLQNTEEGKERAKVFLSEMTNNGKAFGGLLCENIRLVQRKTARYSDCPSIENLVAILPGELTGNWRDSPEGLGYGKFPFDVNGALIPAALDSSIRLIRSGLLNFYCAGNSDGFDAEEMLEKLKRQRSAWNSAVKLFELIIPAGDAGKRAARYAEYLGLPYKEAIESIDEDIVFSALSIDGERNPVPVMNSTCGVSAVLYDPPEKTVLSVIKTILRPFPAGLKTPVGFVVANPAFSDDEKLYRMFGRDAYHGCVIWSWQQALLAAGIAKQLRRTDLSTEAGEAIRAAEREVWEIIERTRNAAASELWTWTIQDGEYRIVPFGQGHGHADESNAAQLWSTVYLAVRGVGRGIP